MLLGEGWRTEVPCRAPPRIPLWRLPPQTLAKGLHLLHERDFVNANDGTTGHHGPAVHDHVLSGVLAAVMNEALHGVENGPDSSAVESHRHNVGLRAWCEPAKIGATQGFGGL